MSWSPTSKHTVPSVPTDSSSPVRHFARDLIAGSVVFLVALPLCLGIAMASGTNLMSGLIAGIVGGLVVAAISGSHTSVSGPAAGLTAIVAAQLPLLGSFEAFLLAVFLAGVLQIAFGIARGGALSAFFPSSVIKGLLAAIGIILILKQIPHLLGFDRSADPAFVQADAVSVTATTAGRVGEGVGDQSLAQLLLAPLSEIHLGAILLSALSIALLVAWDRVPMLKKSLVPAPLLVVLLGVGLNQLFRQWGEPWWLKTTHLVQIPEAGGFAGLFGLLQHPDFTQLANPAIFVAAITIAVVASLESLLNLEAVDKLDKQRRSSPPSRELVAQGCGNMLCGLIGGLPVTSVVVRGSVNVNAGSKTKFSAIFHGLLLLISVAFLARYINMIPLAPLAAILLVTGFKLASPALFRQMGSEGRYQFIPFAVTVVAIVAIDLLYGVLIGLGFAILFILRSNLRKPIRRLVERHIDGDIIHIQLADQVSFLNRAAIETILFQAKPGTRFKIDASLSDYIDPDVLSLIREFTESVAPARNIQVNLEGFQAGYEMNDTPQFATYTTPAIQSQITADQVIELLRTGNQRFTSGNRLNRDLSRQVMATAAGQAPLAAVLSCIDSRVPAELVFDLGVGDIFSVRVAGNVIGTKSLGSLEYAAGIAKVKLLLVLGHTRCGAVTSSTKLVTEHQDACDVTGCEHLQAIVNEIEPSIQHVMHKRGLSDQDVLRMDAAQADDLITEISQRNVLASVEHIVRRSTVIRLARQAGQLKVIGAIYNVCTGEVTFLNPEPHEAAWADAAPATETNQTAAEPTTDASPSPLTPSTAGS